VKVQLNGKDIGGSPLEIYVNPNKVEVQGSSNVYREVLN
jgi:hypothetical protein